MSRTPLALTASITLLPLGSAAGEDSAAASFSERMMPVPTKAKSEDPDCYIWGASMVQDKEGLHHLFCSRWPRELGALEGRAARSDPVIAVAVETDPLHLPTIDKQGTVP